MKINKDQARIVAEALEGFKYNCQEIRQTNTFDEISNLQKKLEDYGKDNRRRGRTTQDSFTDCLKRFKTAKP